MPAVARLLADPVGVVAPTAARASTSTAALPTWTLDRLRLDAGRARTGLPGESPRLRFALAAPDRDVATALATAADSAALPAGASDVDRIRSLEAELGKLQKDVQSTREQVAEVEAHLRQAEGEQLASPLVLALVGLSMLCGVLGGSLWNRRRNAPRRAIEAAPHPPSRSSPGALGPAGVSAPADLPAATTAARSAPGALIDGAVASRRQPLTELAVAPAVAPAATLRVAPASDPRRADAGDSTTAFMGLDPESRDRTSGSVPTRAAVPVDAPPVDAEAERALDEWIDLEQQAEFFVVLGQDETAIELLDAHIQQRGDNPLPYLKLLEINQRRMDKGAYERTREAFNARFHAVAPEWSAGTGAGRGLDEHTQTLSALQSVWSDAVQAVQLLEGFLFRHDSSVEVFEFPAYRDLLFLHSIARDLAGGRAASSLEVDLFLPLDDPGPTVIVDASGSAGMAQGMAAATGVGASAAVAPEHPASPASSPDADDGGAPVAAPSVTLDLDISIWPADETGSEETARVGGSAAGRRVG